jgi:hypothetical protein
LCVVIIELANFFDLAVFDEEQAPRVTIVFDDMGAPHSEGSATVENAIGHKDAVITEAIFKASVVVPFVDSQENLEW